MPRWTVAELASLREAGRDYQKFRELTGSSKSYDAFEVKSRRVRFGSSLPLGRFARLRAFIGGIHR